MKNLCLAGGVALNCVGNGRILREGPFEKIWIQPAAGDAGGALGVALFIWHQLLDKPRTAQPTDAQRGSLLGPDFDDDEIRRVPRRATGAAYDAHRRRRRAVRAGRRAVLAAGKVVGWFQGRMEFGPRALGARSILGDARSPDMQSVMNLKIKFREGFRPFAPAVLREHADEYFECDAGRGQPVHAARRARCATSKRVPLDAPRTQRAKASTSSSVQRSEIPAVTHVDYSARVQTVDAERHGLYRKLLEAFDRKTGCPVLVNTSFNVGGEPIVCTPRGRLRDVHGLRHRRAVHGPLRARPSAAQPAWVARRRAPRRRPLLDDLLAQPVLRRGRCASADDGARLHALRPASSRSRTASRSCSGRTRRSTTPAT